MKPSQPLSFQLSAVVATRSDAMACHAMSYRYLSVDTGPLSPFGQFASRRKKNPPPKPHCLTSPVSLVLHQRHAPL